MKPTDERGIYFMSSGRVDWFDRVDCKGRPQGGSWKGYRNFARVAELSYVGPEGELEYTKIDDDTSYVRPREKPWLFYFKLGGVHYFRKCPLLGMLEMEDYLEKWDMDYRGRKLSERELEEKHGFKRLTEEEKRGNFEMNLLILENDRFSRGE